MTTTHWGLVIKTNEYAGNFERELCAHCTGQIGECGVGEEYITKENQKKFQNIVINRSGEDGCPRPCEIWLSDDGASYTSVIIYFEDKPSQKSIDIIKSRSNTFVDAVKEKDKYMSKNLAKFKILGFKLIEFKSEETEIEV